METRRKFQNRVQNILNQIPEEVLRYNEEEYWMIRSPFEYIEFFAVENRLENTMIALYLARGLHDGGHRKLTVVKNGISYRLPYSIHPLLVCRMLVDLHIPLPIHELDILLASALCHDMIEDIAFENHGRELYTDYFLDEEIYKIVSFLSKRYDFTEEEENAFFHNIEAHELALFVKLSDRGNNVEDLYNMKPEKVYEYVEETDHFFIPMCEYALKNYTNHAQAFSVLRDKIISLTEVAQIFIVRYGIIEDELKDKIEQLTKENQRLHRRYLELWEGEK